MMQSFEDAGKFGKEFMDSGLKSFAAWSTGVQTIGVETADYSKKAFEAGNAAVEKLATAKSLEKFFEVQADYAREAYESFVSQATRMSELYADVAKDVYKPFESAGIKTK